MRKQEDGPAAPYSRLSSSCSSIRSSNYSAPRPYTPSLNTYKYSPSSYTPASRLSTATSSSDSKNTIIASPLPSRSRHSYSSTLSRNSSSSSSSHKTLYSSPAAARVSISANENISSPTNTYRGISRYSSATNGSEPRSYSGSASSSTYDRSRRTERSVEPVKIELGPTTRANMVHPTSSHIRSRSTSYRSINVSQFTQQARERAEREEKDRQYKEWIEREKERENELGIEMISSTHSNAPSTAQNDFRKQMNSSFRNSTSSSALYGTGKYHRSGEDSSNYSSNNAPPPPQYSSQTLSTTTSAYLRNRRIQREEQNKSPIPSNVPPPPPPPPLSNGTIPRSVSAAVISSSLSSYSSIKPTAKVSPYDEDTEKGCVVPVGFTGLRNIGNTCFMNAVLQMLVNNIELRDFFLKSHYKMEINESNPLGSQGRLASAFADFMKQMWSGMHKAIEPIKIKEIVAEKASQFANFAQHDAHEFLSFLLDGLHEDVNRVKNKPLTGTVESDGRHDIDVSNEAWRNHILRNDSIFVDLFHGQLKSHVQCPKCDRISITFDPFVYLPVPFPKRKRSTTVVFWPLDSQSKPIKLNISYSTEGTIYDFLSVVASTVRVRAKNLRAVEVFGHKFDKIYTKDQKASEIGTVDLLYVYEIHDEDDCNEQVIVLYTSQRQLFSNNIRYMCNECGTTRENLSACDGCFNAYYCSKDCQLNNWSSGGHREECRRRPTSDLVGQPLIVSLPKSQLTYQQLYRVLEAKSRYSVTTFQKPNSDDSASIECDVLSVPTSSIKKRSGVGAPPSFLAPAPSKLEQSSSSSSIKRDSSPRRQSVLAEPRFKTQRMFHIRKLNSPNEAFGEALNDGDLSDKLQSESYITMNWINLRFGKEYIVVGNRAQLDCDTSKFDDKPEMNGKMSNKGVPQLAQMLDMFSETERLKPEESWYCSRCKEHVEATKQLQLYRLPPVLIIQLKRFVYTAAMHQSTLHRRSKDERAVEYPLENLDMAPFLADTAPNTSSTIYDLTGVVCHSGSSYFGHYISMGRLADFDSSKTKIEWRQFDDSMVTRQSASTIQSDEAYLLFYKMRDPQVIRSIFKRHYSCDPGEESEEVSEKDS